MRNQTVDILNGARFITQAGGTLAYDAMTRLMNGVSAFPEENWVDALSEGQTLSKQWLIDSLVAVWGNQVFDQTVMVGGWVGLLPLVVTAHGYYFSNWISVDLSQKANMAALMLNPISLSAHTIDMYEFNYPVGSLIINTSGEHIPDLDRWLSLLPIGSRVAIQSNNMFGIDGHVNCVDNENQLIEKTSPRLAVKHVSTLPLPWHGWKRFMVIGEVQ